MINFISKTIKSFKIKFIIFMSTITAVLFFMITHNFHTGYDMTSKYTPLVDAAMEIKLEATTAHLMYEEVMSGDKDESIEDVNLHIDNAIWYANAMIYGGSNSEGVFIAIENKKLISDVNSVLQKLKEFKKITNRHYLEYKESGVSSEIEIKYDALCKEFITGADNVETDLQQIIISDLRSYKYVYFLTIIALVIFITIISFILYQYEKRIRSISIKDPLTKLYNRLYIENIFENELQRAKRHKKTFTVIFIDIDYFKQVNDTFGHDIGDTVLIEISNILKSNIRSLDTLARWGGEEFIILCPETDIESAKILAEKLRKSVESYNIRVDGRTTCTIVGNKTCSFGLSEYTEKDDYTKYIIKRADDALYEAKSSGRNRVVCK